MSRCARDWARAQPFGGARKAVLVTLANYATEARLAWPSIPLIMQETGRSERAIQYALGTLVDDALIAIVQPGGGRGRATHYLLQMEGETVTSTPSGGGGEHLNGANHAPFEGVNGAKIAPFEAETVQELHPLDPEATPQKGANSAPIDPQKGAILTLNGAKVAPESKKKGRKKGDASASFAHARATPLPEDWQPNTEGKSFAANLGLHVPLVAAKFAAWHRKQATRSADWKAEWQLWCLREVEMNADKPERRGNFFAESLWDDMTAAAPDSDDRATRERLAILQIAGGRYGTA